MSGVRLWQPGGAHRYLCVPGKGFVPQAGCTQGSSEPHRYPVCPWGTQSSSEPHPSDPIPPGACWASCVRSWQHTVESPHECTDTELTASLPGCAVLQGRHGFGHSNGCQSCLGAAIPISSTSVCCMNHTSACLVRGFCMEVRSSDVSCMFAADVFSEWGLDPSPLERNQSGVPPGQGRRAWLAPQGGPVRYTLKCW